MRSVLSQLGVLAATVALAISTPMLTPAQAAPPSPKPKTEAELCAGMQRLELAGIDQCTRGPEVLPNADLSEKAKPLPKAVADATMAANAIVCDGNGVAGKRVQVLYARESQQASRLQLFLPSFRAWSHEIDAAYNDSAFQTGASRHIRYVTDAVSGGCQVNVREAVVPTGGLETWNSMVTALQNLGYKDSTRKYLVYADAQKVCGVGTLYGDDRPGLDNANNNNTGYARVDASANCWGFNAAAHELGHNLGAVQSSAPNYNGHCNDEYDLMCYGSDTRVVCADKDNDRLLDCNKDDYFNTNPPAGSYLATHWNLANSDWLIKSATPDPRPGPRHGQIYEFVSPSSGEAIDVVDGSTANLANLSHRPRSGATSQQWRFQYETGWQLQNVNSGKCADSAFSGTTPGTKVLQYSCNGQDGMRWTLHPLGGDVYGIINTLSGLAMTDAGAHPAALEQQPFTGAATQQFKLRPVSVPNGTYRIRSELGKDLDVVNCQGTDIRMWDRVAGSPCQRWQVTAVTDNVYKIVDSNTGNAVEVSGCVTTDARPVQLAPSSANTCQQWRISALSNGAYQILGVGSGKSLDVAGCSAAAGADVIIWPFHGGACQRWYFDAV
ncbi:RICIN domain-containing protein [Kribbella yunnanensis]|uniref:RICIN domain-containing protein n=1 Tax=Kribbella yunnanensis TaxID=190194 RepID=UPI0031D7A0A6